MRPLLRAAALLAVATVSVGCSCSDQNILPFDFPPLENDHGKWLSMDVAPDGNLVVTFYDLTQKGLGFAIGEPRDEATRLAWRYEQVDGYPDSQGLNPGNRGMFSSMKVAADGSVWAAYQDTTNGALKVAHRVGGAWDIETADVGGGIKPEAGLFASLALDSAGQPVVAHHDAATGTLRVARRTGGSWQAETVFQGEDFVGTDADGNPIEREASVGMFARLVISGNTEYLAFYDAAQQTLNLLEGFPGAYSHTVVDDDGNVGQWPSIWTDGTDIAIAYQDVGRGDLKVATRSGGGTFDLRVIDDDQYTGADTEIFRKDGYLGVVYFLGRYNDMQLATDSADGWSYASLGGEEAAVGFHNEVAQDKAGRWWAASYDFTHKNIYVTRMFTEAAPAE